MSDNGGHLNHIVQHISYSVILAASTLKSVKDSSAAQLRYRHWQLQGVFSADIIDGFVWACSQRYVGHRNEKYLWMNISDSVAHMNI